MSRRMKDSGIEWIGEIPEDWGVKSLKYLINSNQAGNWGNEEKKNKFSNNRICIRIADFDYPNMTIRKDREFTLRYYTDSEIKKYSLKYGDILIEKSGGGEKTPVGRTIIWKEDISALYANFIERLRMKTNDIIPMFAQYSFYAFYGIGGSNLYFNQTTGLQNLDITRLLNNLKLTVPKIDIQSRIVQILDIKTRKIEEVKNTINEEIKTLEDYKKSIITEAVTKGLDKNVEMKDSGIEWIGEIPEHWDVTKIKYNLIRKEEKNPGDKELLSVYREFGVIPKSSRTDNHNKASLDTSNYKYVKPGYLVINKMKAWQGSMGVSKYNGVVSPAYYIYIFANKEMFPFYIHYLFRTVYIDEFKRISGGIREGQWDLSAQMFEDTLIINPPYDEQEEIIKFINAKVLTLEDLIEVKKQQLETLEEYKKSLIYEYVTGKKEVKYV